MEKFAFAAVVTAAAGIIFYTIDEASAPADVGSKAMTNETSAIVIKANSK